jgi:hypothetical protein
LGDALSDADAERLSKRHLTEYHLLKIELNAGKQNPNVDGQCLMNVGEMVDEAVNEPHGATASQSAGSSNSCAAAANSEIEQLGIDIDFVLNCGDAVDSKWAPSAECDISSPLCRTERIFQSCISQLWVSCGVSCSALSMHRMLVLRPDRP